MRYVISGVLLCIGIALAGSDGEWFPYINFAGCIVACIACYITGKGVI